MLLLLLSLNLKLKSMCKIILIYLDLLYMGKEITRVFTPKLTISFCSARKLSSYLVRAKLYTTERAEGSNKCDEKRCRIS